ncbi:glycosyltransferase [Arthrobacter sp. SDTb3-6]|uniref:glycosyltransferase n=1 Tax=Arthrobacter sp. SDTb3-6 TaxID=2713571 RepID=UPI00159E1FE9|nr:glycosyltransferase [Arthrobacter sp. SDTb3-6]NVN00096.1 glycosyltransferase family 4 protein [Arthrobacter sp. SDTb3-6]
MRNIVIVQQYVPSYRIPFFEALSATLEMQEIELTVAASTPPRSLSKRSDSADAKWITRVPEYRIDAVGKSLILGGSHKSWKKSDGVILPLQGTCIDSYRALMGANRHSRRVGLWGHVKSYVNAPNRIDIAAERWLMERADQIFAYTPGGARFAVASGIKSNKITTVMNSVNTDSLEIARKSLTDSKVKDFRGKYDIPNEHNISYIGALDESKRIKFLCNVLDKLWIEDPSITLLVGGRGDQEHLLNDAVKRGQCKMLGYVDDEAKALMGHVSAAIVIPGRIGLVAVESLLLGLPILSTNWPYHAPESEYLTEGSTLYTSENTIPAYAHLIMKSVNGGTKKFPNEGCPIYPTLANMVQNFTTGISKMLS